MQVRIIGNESIGFRLIDKSGRVVAFAPTRSLLLIAARVEKPQ